MEIEDSRGLLRRSPTRVIDDNSFSNLDHHDNLENKSSILAASFNFINSIVGAGIIGLPFALYECGFVSGVLALLTVGCLTKLSVDMIIESANIVVVTSYEGLVLKVSGRYGKMV